MVAAHVNALIVLGCVHLLTAHEFVSGWSNGTLSNAHVILEEPATFNLSFTIIEALPQAKSALIWTNFGQQWRTHIGIYKGSATK